MITQLRFKNWRSLKDVTIPDLQPINVFIGANSSGKTNILDGLHFLRHSLRVGIEQAVFGWKLYSKVRTLGVEDVEPVELELSYLSAGNSLLKETMRFKFQRRDIPFEYSYTMQEGNEILLDTGFNEIPYRERFMSRLPDKPEKRKRQEQFSEHMDSFIKERWQMLDANFMPPLSIGSEKMGDVYLLDRCADNLLSVLEYMWQISPKLYSNLQEDLRWILSHVNQIETERNDRELRLLLTENFQVSQEAPTVSAGTSRILAMLTAFYALDMRLAELPGLVVIEEPDTALNPGLLKRFVEQIRVYIQHEHPRQFIFTTHNPSFLNFFEPEEVRVVERDEQGYTSVHRIPPHIKEIWLDKYGLGEVWTTRSFGGVPE